MVINNVDRLPFSEGIKAALGANLGIIQKELKGSYKVVLFGSYARADYNSRSDFDLLVLSECEIDRHIRGKLQAVLAGMNSDLVFYTTEAFENSDCRFVYEVKRDGVLLFERS